jgi:hypothetical protein
MSEAISILLIIIVIAIIIEKNRNSEFLSRIYLTILWLSPGYLVTVEYQSEFESYWDNLYWFYKYGSDDGNTGYKLAFWSLFCGILFTIHYQKNLNSRQAKRIIDGIEKRKEDSLSLLKMRNYPKFVEEEINSFDMNVYEKWNPSRQRLFSLEESIRIIDFGIGITLLVITFAIFISTSFLMVFVYYPLVDFLF